MGLVRLDKFISTQTIFSRSEIRKMIFKGMVTVDGKVVCQPDFKIDEKASEINLEGKKIEYEQYVYLVMNKPAGVLSATSDKNCKTAVDLLPQEYSKRNIFPAGRLDKDSTGMILLTDDGDFAHKITSPKHHIEKAYIVELDGEVQQKVIDAFAKGVTLADGTVCSPAVCQKIESNKARVILTEGKYHQIKRMFGVFDLGVNSLHRERMGNLTMPKSLAFGDFYKIKPEDIVKNS